ncbi:TIGR02301 family protein [Phyllobacterium phragmitis]|uniref:TIGR02301 family protein n=2 Tax=Phyllobacterium phragmitis TaxID=2670329 RepID=A0A2S9IZQ9_9HYPH|nr:TIGR02301 family protein [Phyllobacterium phragmitis]
MAGLIALPAAAATVNEPPYEAKLIRLAEILGSLHYLRNLCGEPGNEWRDRMNAIIAAEKPEKPRRARIISSFNRGYRAFSEVYSSCTDSSVAAIDRYMKEGEGLSNEIAARYGN